MSEEEKQEKEFEEIKKKGKYAECHIMIDSDKPEEVACKIQGRKTSAKVMYGLLLAVREVEKQMLDQYPELKVIDLIKPYATKSVPIHKEENSISSPLAELMKEIGKRIDSKGENDG